MGIDFIKAKEQLTRFNRDSPRHLGKAIQQFFEVPSSRRTIFHYTRQPAFQGIIENRELWLTDLQFCNDRSESEHAFSLLDSHIKRQLARRSIPLDSDFLRLLRKRLVGTAPVRFVTCFSLKGDDLNQWRSYGSPGPGYCLGFNHGQLRILAARNNGLFGRCIYSIEDKQLAMERLLDVHLSSLDGCFPYFGKNDINEDLLEFTVKRFIREFTRIAPLFKHESFEEEAEVRLVLGEPPTLSDIRFRCGAHALIPYRKISLLGKSGPSCLPEVVIAMSNGASEVMMLGLRKFLTINDYDPTIARLSAIPYRESV